MHRGSVRRTSDLSATRRDLHAPRSKPHNSGAPTTPDHHPKSGVSWTALVGFGVTRIGRNLRRTNWSQARDSGCMVRPAGTHGASAPHAPNPTTPGHPPPPTTTPCRVSHGPRSPCSVSRKPGETCSGWRCAMARYPWLELDGFLRSGLVRLGSCATVAARCQEGPNCDPPSKGALRACSSSLQLRSVR